MAVWSTHRSGQLTREGRVQERRIDGYLELLRLVERRSLWFETLADRAELVGDPYAKLPPLPPEPEASELATIKALLAAFGSEKLKTVCSRWTDAVKKFERASEIAEWNWEQDYSGPDTPMGDKDLAQLREEMVAVATERTRVELIVAEEIEQIQRGG